MKKLMRLNIWLFLICLLVFLVYFLISLDIRYNEYRLIINRPDYFEPKFKELEKRQRELDFKQKRLNLYILLYKEHVLEAQNY